MADSWYEYVYGGPDQRAQEWRRNQRQYDEITSSPLYRELRYMEPFELNGREVDPRQMRMHMVMDTLVPGTKSDAVDHMNYAWKYGMDFGSRPRDTAFRAAQEVAKGNYGDAIGKTLAIPITPFVPSMASGAWDSEDDWRQHAGPAQAMAIDVLTDPLTYGTLGIKPALRALPGLARRAGALRYGRGAQTFLVDEAGDVIRQLRRSPRAQPMRIEYAPR